MVKDAEGLNQPPGNYPFLESLLNAKGLTDKGIWSIRDVAGIFAVKSRAVYDWIANGKLAVRDLPGRGRFLSEDLEEFLRNSKRPPKGRRGSQGER
jgi:helix-turn-helix protein